MLNETVLWEKKMEPDSTYPYHAFEVHGIELEYMIVNQTTLDIMPITDLLLQAVSGTVISDVEKEPIGWSNELALHVFELKTTHPVTHIAGTEELFQQEIILANHLLKPHGAFLMPTGMHPWMDPHKEMHLWPHGDALIYRTFDKIFNCKGHGWCNLQSCHLNLPFGNEEEFIKLHAAIRLLLPILPALSASSPIANGSITPFKDTRLEVYRFNCKAIPSITGDIIPERCDSYRDYHKKILKKIYTELKPHDPDGILKHEWVNARGAITRFERGSIEIRVLDTQECPAADIAIASFVTQVLKSLTEERWAPLKKQQEIPTSQLKEILMNCIVSAETAFIDHPAYLSLLGQNKTPLTAQELWQNLFDSSPPLLTQASASCLNIILNQGTLATRILKSLGTSLDHDVLKTVYHKLCHNLASGTPFTPLN